MALTVLRAAQMHAADGLAFALGARGRGAGCCQGCGGDSRSRREGGFPERRGPSERRMRRIEQFSQRRLRAPGCSPV